MTTEDMRKELEAAGKEAPATDNYEDVESAYIALQTEQANEADGKTVPGNPPGGQSPDLDATFDPAEEPPKMEPGPGAVTDPTPDLAAEPEEFATVEEALSGSAGYQAALSTADGKKGDKDPKVVDWCRRNLSADQFAEKYAGRGIR